MNYLNTSIFNKGSFLLLLLYFLCFHIHILLTDYIYFYRELFFTIFCILSFFYIRNYKIKFLNIFLNKDILIFSFSYLLFFIILFFNQGDIDPEFSQKDSFLQNITNKNILALYVIRNFALFIPIMFFFYLRGISKYEFRKILFFYFFMGIINYLVYIFYYVDINILGFTTFIYNNNYLSSYNTYIPLISGIFIVGIYLSLTAKKYSHIFIFTCVTSFYFFIILISSGKASILFSLISLIYLIIVLFKNKKKLLFFIIIFFSFNFIFHITTIHFVNIGSDQIKDTNKIEEFNKKKFGFNDNPIFDGDKSIYPIISRWESRSDLNPRKVIYKEFANYLKISFDNKMIFFFGTGSLISLISGFHNDYMRLFYRSGLIGMIFSFIPIFYFLFKCLFYSYRNLFFNEKSNITHLLTVLLTFIPFYSLFAYPREDVFQAGIFSLSLILYFGSISSNSKYEEYKTL